MKKCKRPNAVRRAGAAERRAIGRRAGRSRACQNRTAGRRALGHALAGRAAKQQIILGLVGEIASGKDTVADYLIKNRGAQKISFSQSLRDILTRLDLPQNRANLAHLGIDLRRRFGQDVLARAVIAAVKTNQASIIVLPNVRLPQDIALLKKMPEFMLVAIAAEPKIRYARLIKRRQNADDRAKTWPQFLRDSHLSTETKIRALARRAKFKIDNNGDFDALYAQIEKILTAIGC